MFQWPNVPRANFLDSVPASDEVKCDEHGRPQGWPQGWPDRIARGVSVPCGDNYGTTHHRVSDLKL